MWTDLQFPESFLSPPVLSLLRERGKNSAARSFLTPFATFNWEHITPLFANLPGNFRNSEDNFEVYKSLWPVFHQARQHLLSCGLPPIHLWKWIHSDDQLFKCFQEIQQEHDSILPLKLTLFLTSVFERALGNMCASKGKCVPFLLRDILSSEELLAIFGPTPMTLAQVLLGTPHAFNIRNICWHGFPAPEEITMEFPATLMILIFSFGDILDGLSLQDFPCRPQVTRSDWDVHLKTLKSTEFPLLLDVPHNILKIIQKCPVIPPTHKKYWLTAINYFKNERYGESLLLLLPAFEHLLRCLFCIANSCPKQIFLAEQHTYYITIDEVLAKARISSEGSESENLIRTLIGDKLLEMLLDVFNYFAGPRIRDKVSHGECDLGQVPGAIVNHLVCICLLIIGKVCDISCLEYCTELTSAEESYISQFHPASLLVKQINSVRDNLQTLKLFSQRVNVMSYVTPKEIDFESFLSDLLQDKACSLHCDVSCKINSYLTKSLETLYRSKSDLAIITFLLKIVSSLEKAVHNCNCALEERIHLHQEHKLRSRQRRTYAHMLEYVLTFQSVFTCMVLIVLVQFFTLPERIFRFMKKVLKYVENMASLSDTKKNRWGEMRSLTVETTVQLMAIFKK